MSSSFNSGGSWAWIRGRGSAHAFDHAQGRGPLALEDGHEHRAPAVAADDVGLDPVAVRHVRHVLDVDRDAVGRTDRYVVERRDRLRATVELDDVLRVPHLRRAGRYDQVLATDGRADVGRRKGLIYMARARMGVMRKTATRRQPLMMCRWKKMHR